jgi:hypothetical protein
MLDCNFQPSFCFKTLKTAGLILKDYQMYRGLVILRCQNSSVFLI